MTECSPEETSGNCSSLKGNNLQGVDKDWDGFLVEVKVALVLHVLVWEIDHLGQHELVGLVP